MSPTVATSRAIPPHSDRSGEVGPASQHIVPWQWFFYRNMSVPNDVGCMPWLGTLNRFTGYGSFHINGGGWYAHRLSYALFVGDLDPDLTIDHLCRNPPCVNPSHLEQVTLRENILRSTNMAARNARKTECDHGHPFDAANTYMRKDGKRACRACINARGRMYRAAAKAVSA